MTKHPRIHTWLLVLLAAGASSACRDAPLAVNIHANNKSPIAHAGEMQTLDYDGEPVTVTLDGSRSSDPDGTIVTYRWLSGLETDAGIGRGGKDPDDVVSPKVTLDAGTWVFTLFVIDDEGGVSKPDSVTIQVGDDLPPPVAECIAAAEPSIADDCKLCVCSIDDICQGLLPNCDKACWDFYTCSENNCRELTGDPSADRDALSECVVGNCSDLFNGVGTWMTVESCVRRDPCGTICTNSVKPM